MIKTSIVAIINLKKINIKEARKRKSNKKNLRLIVKMMMECPSILLNRENHKRNKEN